MDFIDFVIENYIWFIVGGLAVLMIIIGYFAEKTQFGKKPTEKHSKEKEVKVSLPKEETVIDDEIETIPHEVEKPVVSNEMDSEESDIEEPMASLDEVEIAEPTVEEPMADLEEEETDESTQEHSVDSAETNSDEIPEDLYVGLDGTPNTYKNNSSTNDFDTDLPNIDSLKDDTNLDDDDIWKF